MNGTAKKRYPNILSEQGYKEAKRNASSMFVYANNLLKKLRNYLFDERTGICLFDKNGCLLRKYFIGNSFEGWAEEIGFVSGSLWNISSMGQTAISEGLEKGQSCKSVGKENDSMQLRDIFIYFSPIYQIMTTPDRYRIEKLCGGLAIMGPQKLDNKSYGMLVSMMADAVEREIDARDWTVSLIDGVTSGMFVLEKHKNKVQISSCTEKIKKMFHLPENMSVYEEASQYFDPAPDNKEFWQIVYNHKIVREMDITLSVLGKKYLVTVSTDSYLEKLSNSYIVSFIVTSRKTTKNQVVKRAGHYAKATFDDIIGESAALQKTISLAKAAAGFGMNVLLLGESGVGKDLFAQAIHNASKQANGPFVPLNCAAIPRDLLASELFGYEHGAFTGAKKGGQIGKFELADGGTLFLDEIGDLPLDLQTLLLRTLEEKSLMRLGSNISLPVNVRIIAATNVNLQEQIAKKMFREDLFYRLNKFCINIPALREREGDTQLLLEYFFRQSSLALHGTEYKISKGVLDYFAAFPWRGNVRELQSYAEMLACLNPYDIESMNQLTNIPEILSVSKESVLKEPAVSSVWQPEIERTDKAEITTLKEEMSKKKAKCRAYTIRGALTKEDIEQTLTENRYNKMKTAEQLGISRSTLYKILREYGLN